MLRDLLEVMAGAVCSIFVSIGMIERPFGPLHWDFALFGHLPAMGAEIHGEAQTLKRSLFVKQKCDNPLGALTIEEPGACCR